MPDTSSAAYRRHADGPEGPLMVSGIEPIDCTWFDTADEPPADRPLIILLPVQRDG